MPLASVLGKNLRGIRASRDLDQVQFAALLRITQSTVSAYELGKVSLTLATLEHLADRLHCEPWELLQDSEKKSRKSAEVLLQ